MSLFSQISGMNSGTIKNLYDNYKDEETDYSDVDFSSKDDEVSCFEANKQTCSFEGFEYDLEEDNNDFIG